MIDKKNKPEFNVSNKGLRKSRLKNRNHRWRRPRADSNKKKMKLAFAGASPRVGYKNTPAVRGLHPSGLPEVTVHNSTDLDGLSNVVVRIASAVGAKKAVLIEKAAKTASLRILNPRRIKKKEPKKKEEESAKKEKPKVAEEKKKVEKPETKAAGKKEEKSEVPKSIASKPETENPKPETPKPETTKPEAAKPAPKASSSVSPGDSA
jgi:ribosomal protein L32E